MGGLLIGTEVTQIHNCIHYVNLFWCVHPVSGPLKNVARVIVLGMCKNPREAYEFKSGNLNRQHATTTIKVQAYRLSSVIWNS